MNRRILLPFLLVAVLFFVVGAAVDEPASQPLSSRLISAKPAHFASNHVNTTATSTSDVINRMPTNLAGDLGIHSIDVSQDGRYIVFTSNNPDLVFNDTNGVNDVFLYDTHTEIIRRISVGWGGAETNGSSGSPFISADGQVIVYISNASNIDPADDNNSNDAFIFNLSTNKTERIVMPDDVRESFHSHPQYTDISSITSISDDGNRIALLALYATYGYVYDHRDKQFFLVTVNSEGNPGNGHNGNLLLSANGLYVFFNSNTSTLVLSDTNKRYDGFRHDLQTRETIRVTVGTDSIEANDGSYMHNGTLISPSNGNLIQSISYSGTHVLFTSPATNIYTNSNNSLNLFQHNLETNTTERIPIDPYWSNGFQLQSIRNPEMANDGALILFRSGNNTLVAGDTNNRDDVFIYDMENYPNPIFELASAGYDGLPADGTSDYPQMPNGTRYVYFASNSTNLTNHNDDSTGHIFVYDRVLAGTTPQTPKALTYPGPFDDEHFVRDHWSSLDILTKEIIEFPIFLDRYYFHPESVSQGKISFDENGFLTQDSIDTLVQDGAFIETAELVLQIYNLDDVEGSSNVCDNDETISIEVNGHTLENEQAQDVSLANSPEGWTIISIPVPISGLKLPQEKGVDGNPPESAHNIIRLIPRPCNDGYAVAWGYIKIAGIIRPILTVPGWTDNVDVENIYTDTFAFATFYRDFGLNSHLPIQTPVNYGDGIRPYDTSAQLVYHQIDKTQREFGVDHINIFGHSRGGLFTRRALNLFEYDVPVENVFTFSTPHHGSWPNAEDGLSARAKCLSKYHESIYSIERQWCKDSANSMTLDQMRLFNFRLCLGQIAEDGNIEWHKCQQNPYAWEVPNVNYYSVAGIADGVIGGVINRKEETAIFPWLSTNWRDYGGHPFPHEEDDKSWNFQYDCENIAWLFAADLRLYAPFYVRDILDCHKETARSVNTFCYALGTLVASVKDDLHTPQIANIKSCQHDQLQGASTVFESSASSISNIEYHEFIDSNGRFRTFYIENEIASEEQQIISIPISATNDAIITLRTNQEVEPLSLWNPTSMLIVPDGINTTQSVITNTEYGNFYQYRLISPATGKYDLQFMNALSTPVYYAISAVVSDTISLNTWTAQFSATPNDIITVTALLDGYTNPVTITADITDPDGLIQTIQLSQNISASNPISGYVVYDGAATLSTAEGFHDITTRAEAGYLVRLASTSIAVYSRTAQIGEATQVTLPDADNDNLYDSIDFEIELDVLREGYYALFAELVGPSGEIARTTFSSRVGLSATLPVTTHLITFSFPGESIYASGQSGPYTLTNVTAIDENGFGFTVDTQDNLTNTAEYLPLQFEGERTVTLDSIMYATADDDSNGLYDTMQFTLTADSQLTGTFRISGRLVDEYGGTIGWANNEITITDTGDITPTLIFSGSQISGHQVHGAYALRDLNMLSAEGTGWYKSNLTATIPYSYTQFEGLDQISIEGLIIIRSGSQISVTWPDAGLSYEIWLTNNPYTAPSGDCLSADHCTVQVLNQFVLNEPDLSEGLQTIVVLGVYNDIRTQFPEAEVGVFKFRLQPGN